MIEYNNKNSNDPRSKGSRGSILHDRKTLAISFKRVTYSISKIDISALLTRKHTHTYVHTHPNDTIHKN